MDAGLVAALAADRRADSRRWKSTRCTSRTCRTPSSGVLVLLNLSRDQLDRVGEINVIERTCGGLARHPNAVVVANCDDVLMTSAAYDSPTWCGWRRRFLVERLVSCRAAARYRSRTWALVLAGRLQTADHSGGSMTKRVRPDGLALPMRLRCRRSQSGNATQASRPPSRWARSGVGRRRGRRSRRGRRRYRSFALGRHKHGSCWPRTRPAGRKRCRWWTNVPPEWSSPSTDSADGEICPGCGMCASNISRGVQNDPVVAAG
ncbi:putative murein peptide ligase [Mycobacterium ulcerans str. Harvey]|uniref:Murein peptide ligase n=1 Tax=Mycobacterium ulcerans str. Harvey TaxID=1299332 RepID=A0ABN0RAN4_MYCUL|nr:putative murein peptide ligase [Mycobacterium ulcerans str. Harvey]